MADVLKDYTVISLEARQTVEDFLQFVAGHPASAKAKLFAVVYSSAVLVRRCVEPAHAAPFYKRAVEGAWADTDDLTYDDSDSKGKN